MRPDFFIGKYNVHRVAWLSLGIIQKCVDACDMAVNETGRFQRGTDSGKIGAANQDIDILCVANLPFIDPGNPNRYRTVAGNGISNLGDFERGGDLSETLPDLFRGDYSSIERKWPH